MSIQHEFDVWCLDKVQHGVFTCERMTAGAVKYHHLAMLLVVLVDVSLVQFGIKFWKTHFEYQVTGLAIWLAFILCLVAIFCTLNVYQKVQRARRYTECGRRNPYAENRWHVANRTMSLKFAVFWLVIDTLVSQQNTFTLFYVLFALALYVVSCNELPPAEEFVL